MMQRIGLFEKCTTKVYYGKIRLIEKFDGEDAKNRKREVILR